MAPNPQDAVEQASNAIVGDALEEHDDGLEAFDWSLYSALIRKERKDKGYKTAEAFSATIYRRTRVNISRDSIYKIEQGKQIPDPLQFMAINMSLYDQPLPYRVIELCFCTEWRDIVQDQDSDIPMKWKYENFVAAVKATGKDPTNAYLTPEQVGLGVGEVPYLFANPNPKPVYDDDIPF